MAEPHERRVFGLDFYRACAIGCVVLSHGGLAVTLMTVLNHVAPVLGRLTPWISIIQHGGVVGVELFFVLSGFLIGRILLRSAGEAGRGASLLRFYGRRWFRTLPLFWLFVLLNLIFERFWHGRPIGLGEALGHAFFLRNFTHLSLTFFGESWSLAVEEWFYVLFPAVLWIAVRFARASFDRTFLAAAVVFFIVAVGARCRGALQPGAVWTDAQRCVVIFRFDALMTGVVAAWLSVRRPEAWRRRARLAAVLGAAVFLAAYGCIWTYSSAGVGLAPDTFFAKTFRYSLFSFGFALLLPAASQWVPAREGWMHLSIRKIALWSYAMYLVNWPLFQILTSSRLNRWHGTWDGTGLFFLIEMGLLVILSAGFYHFYEAPCTRLRERFSRKAMPG